MEMHGIQRMPTLFFNTPFAWPDEINLSRYKILINEPLHDISNNIKNIQEEFPHHVLKEKKCMSKNIIAQSFNEKEAKKPQQITEKACWLLQTGLLETWKTISLPIFWYHFVKYKKFYTYLIKTGPHLEYYADFWQHFNIQCFWKCTLVQFWSQWQNGNFMAHIIIA